MLWDQSTMSVSVVNCGQVPLCWTLLAARQGEVGSLSRPHPGPTDYLGITVYTLALATSASRHQGATERYLMLGSWLEFETFIVFEFTASPGAVHHAAPQPVIRHLPSP